MGRGEYSGDDGRGELVWIIDNASSKQNNVKLVGHKYCCLGVGGGVWLGTPLVYSTCTLVISGTSFLMCSTVVRYFSSYVFCSSPVLVFFCILLLSL